VSNEFHGPQQSGRVAMHVRDDSDQQRNLLLPGVSYHGRRSGAVP
jgi:hypothetical protein